MMSSHVDHAETVSQWRIDAGQDNPAGPLFSHGLYAEADIVSEAAASVFQDASSSTGCTVGHTTLCC